jgi:toxin HigB-1
LESPGNEKHFLDNTIASRYYQDMILSFASKETEKIFNGQISKKLPKDIQRTARRKLRYLNRALSLQDLLAPPGNKLEKLKGNRAGQHSIRINNQWRICFTWSGKSAKNVEIVDYHN